MSSNFPRSSTAPCKKDEENLTDQTTYPSSSLKSIQNMLKTSTEIGNLSLFDLRRPYVPRSLSCGYPLHQFSDSVPWSITNPITNQNLHGTRRSHISTGSGFSSHFSQTSSNGLVPSGLSIQQQSCRPRKGNHPDRRRFRPNPTTPHELYSHRSVNTLRSCRDVHSTYSSSPSTYGHHKRRQNRPVPSFSLSETMLPGYDHLSTNSRIRKFGPYSSPGSFRRVRQSMTPVDSGRNESLSSILRLPSPLLTYSENLQRGDCQSRSTTPRSFTLHKFSTVPPTKDISTQKTNTPASGPHTPRYYDYSESFDDGDGVPIAPETGVHMGKENIFKKLDQPLKRAKLAQTPYGVRPGSTFRPTELPTLHNRTPSEYSKHGFKGVVPKRISSLAAVEYIVHPDRNVREDHDNQSRKFLSLDEVEKESLGSRRLSTASPPINSSTNSRNFFPNAKCSPRDLTSLAVRIHSPILAKGDKSPTLSSTSPTFDVKSESEASSKCISDPRARQDWVLPDLNLSPLSFSPNQPGRTVRPNTTENAECRQKEGNTSPPLTRSLSLQNEGRPKKTPESNKQDVLIYAKSPNNVAKLSAENFQESIELPQESVKRLKIQRSSREGFWSSDSPEKSTIESLLDKHIECLGLPGDIEEYATTDVDSDEQQSEFLHEDNVSITHSSDILHQNELHRPLTSCSCRNSSLATLERRKLRPRRLFASLDIGRPGSSATNGVSILTLSTSTDSASTRQSRGWQKLDSTSFLASSTSMSKPSLLSGELADIDTSQASRFPLRSRLNIVSSFCEPNTQDVENGSSMRDIEIVYPESKTRSQILARQESHRKRRMRIRLRSRSHQSSIHDILSHSDIEPSHLPLPPMEGIELGVFPDTSVSPINGYVELSAESAIRSNRYIAFPKEVDHFDETRQWSSIIAAMPDPSIECRNIGRKASIRTFRSQRSQSSLADPINSTRLSSQINNCGSVPRMFQANFKSTLSASDLDLSFPRGLDLMTTNSVSKQPQEIIAKDRSNQRKQHLGLRKHQIFNIPSIFPYAAENNIPNSVTGRKELKLSHSCRLKGRKSEEDQIGPDDLNFISDFAYKKHKIIEKVKNWWKKQCMQKMIAMRRQKTSDLTSGVLL